MYSHNTVVFKQIRLNSVTILMSNLMNKKVNLSNVLSKLPV